MPFLPSCCFLSSHAVSVDDEVTNKWQLGFAAPAAPAAATGVIERNAALALLIVCFHPLVLARMQLPSPWKPSVVDETDTSNISSEFTSEPVGVTPTPAGYRLRDALEPGEGSAHSFSNFTYTPDHAMVIGSRYALLLHAARAAVARCFAPQLRVFGSLELACGHVSGAVVRRAVAPRRSLKRARCDDSQP